MLNPTPSAIRAASRTLRYAPVRKNFVALGRRRFHADSQHKARNGSGISALAAAGLVGFVGFVGYKVLSPSSIVHAEAPPPTTEEQKAKLSSQHAQITSSLENPGVYAWGDNSGNAVAPDSNERVIKAPRRFKFFDGMVLRDLKLCEDSGVAVDDHGNVLQWGNAYKEGATQPEVTLKGKNIGRVALSQDKIIALSKDRTIYSFPISSKYQQNGEKPSESSWIPGMSSKSDMSYCILKPQLGRFESVIDVAAGRDHLLVLTSNGRVFSSAASFHYPAKGQLGIPGLLWDTRPTDKPTDALHEVTALKDRKIKQVAAGDYHSLALDDRGRVFCFGDNLNGQLGFEYSLESNVYDAPKELKIRLLYPECTPPKATRLAAGGSNSYFMIDIEDPSRTTVDVLACGTGIHGNLGNGRWTHIQGTPTKVKSLSGLFEYDERTNKLTPIRLAALHVGATHAAAIMANSTKTNAASLSNLSDVNYGNDVLWWGNNEHFQLGTGKRNNTSVPVYIGPLDRDAAPDPDFTSSSRRGGSNLHDERQSGIIGGADREESGRFTGKDQVHRFQTTPEAKTKSGHKAVQTIFCGRGNTAVYMKAV